MATGPADVYNFELADRAYGMFSLDEKRQALAIMATLQYPSVTDRFFEAVSQVVRQTMQKEVRDGKP